VSSSLISSRQDLCNEAMESLIGFGKQFCRSLKIDLSVADRSVPQVCAEQRQAGHDILACAIPEQQAIHSKRMAFMPLAA
jgi:hypothetical protein